MLSKVVRAHRTTQVSDVARTCGPKGTTFRVARSPPKNSLVMDPRYRGRRCRCCCDWRCRAILGALCFGVLVLSLTLLFQEVLDDGEDPGRPCPDGAEGYYQKDALEHLQYSRAAFCTEPHVVEWDCGSICKAVNVLAGTVRFLGPGQKYQVQGFVAVRPDNSSAAQVLVRCIVAFRGTVVKKNWMADFQAWQSTWPPFGARWCEGCKVHHGFVEAYEELKGQMISAIRELKCSEVAVTGHSLGAALATLAALEVRAELGLLVRVVFLFGSPRVGNTAFAEAFDSAAASQNVSPPAWRVVHYHDPIPRLAPSLWHYQHVSREVYYYTRAENVREICAPTDEDRTCSAATPVHECINGDHLKYFNLTMAHSELQEDCVGQDGAVAQLHF